MTATMGTAHAASTMLLEDDIMTATVEQEAFDRGHAAGKRDARLDGHDDQLEGINTNLGSLSDQLRDLSIDLTGHINKLMLQVQELALNAQSSAKATLMLAEGIEKERKSNAEALVKEKDKDEKRWTPLQRFLAILAGVVGVVVVGVAVLSLVFQ